MNREVPAPSDARERAVRSLLWGLFIDLSAGVIVVLMTAFNAIEWTREYWVGLGLILAKTALQSIVAYFARNIFPPNDVARRPVPPY